MITNVAASQGSLVGVDAGSGQPLRGKDFVAVRVPIRYEDGINAAAEITDWKTSAAGLDYFRLLTADGQEVCGTEEDGLPISAIMVPAVFDLNNGRQTQDSSLYTIACHGGAIATCIEHGYRIWNNATETYDSTTVSRSLAPYHAACVAMIRADYCGDGQAHSIAGTLIDFRDALGTHEDTKLGTTDPALGPWLAEAEWAADGAWCIEHTRFMPQQGMSLQDNQDATQNPDWAYVMEHCPTRIAGFPSPSGPPRPCGSASTLLPLNGFYGDQSQRSVLANSSPLYRN